jgi:chemotaxis signal transduction protein
LAALAVLPGATPPLFGVTAWRGELLTILDLRVPLGLSRAALNDLGYVLVLGESHVAFGVLADTARGIVTLASSEVRPLSEGAAERGEYLRGITPEAVLVLDGRALLQSFGVSSS